MVKEWCKNSNRQRIYDRNQDFDY